MPDLQEEMVKTSKRSRLQHIVKINDDGTASDTCLCGYLWDKINIAPDGDVCQECVEIWRRECGY